MPFRTLSSWRPVALGALTLGLAAGGWAWYESRADYVSKGLLAARRALLPQAILATEAITSEDLNRAAQTVLSRASLSNVIRSHDLFAAEQTAQPLEDVIEQLRKAVKIERTGDDGWSITFRYRDALKAQTVNQAIMNSLEDEVKRNRSLRVGHALDFVESRRARLRSGSRAVTARAVALEPPLESTMPTGLIVPRGEEMEPSQLVREDEFLARQLAMIRLWKELEESREAPRLVILEAARFPLGNLVQQYLPWSILGVTTLGSLLGGLLGMLTAAAYRIAKRSPQLA